MYVHGATSGDRTTLVTILFRQIMVCWLVMISISLASCCMPVLASEVPEDLPPEYQDAPILTTVDHRIDYPLAWHNLKPTWFLNVSDVEYTIHNPTAEPVSVRLTSQYPDYSNSTTTVTKIDANSTSTVDHSIILDVEKIQEITTTTRANLQYRIEYRDDGDWIVHEEQTKPVTFYPMDQMVWATEDSSGKITIYHGLVATFITPQSRGVADLLVKAKEQATSDVDERYALYGLERSFKGYSSPGSLATYNDTKNYTTLQAKAIYNALKYDYNLSYVDAPVAFGMGDSQRVSTPDESLSSGSANCIDGAVLFASALERIGIRPYIVITRNHAYVAWDTDSIGTEKDFLETTSISDHDFEEANVAGTEKWRTDSENMELYQNLFDLEMSREEYSSKCILVDIDWLRSQDIFPMGKRSEEGTTPLPSSL